ncbi:hypothetical protein QFZ20_002264 [Flavobacterium sp. W4I14]|nr:hypothetical protein [Flavobacterium sp. W4I14]
MKKIIIILFAIVLLNFNSGCKKLVTVDLPKNQLNTEGVFSDTSSTKAALVNIYSLIDKTIDNNLNKYMSMYTDDLTIPGSPNDEFWNSNLSTGNSTVLNFWKNSYFAIYSCNEVIDRLSNNTDMPPAFTVQAVGEARFLRAYLYFYLINSFGNVPLILSTNVSENISKGRDPITVIYGQIETDLNEAELALPENIVTGKTRANKWAVRALKARISLYQQKYNEAVDRSTRIISSGLYSPLPVPSEVFLSNSKESILQIWTPNGFVADGTTLIPASGRPTYVLSPNLLNSFENGDLRKTLWTKAVTVSGISYSYSFKYHNRIANTSTPEYLVLLRLSEQYLIRAEALANLGSLSEAITDLNVLRKRAGLALLSMNLSKEDCQAAIYREWRSEFFMEAGHRFMELRRTGRLQETISFIKPNWPSKSVLLPIPQNEITYNQTLTQNPGY